MLTPDQTDIRLSAISDASSTLTRGVDAATVRLISGDAGRSEFHITSQLLLILALLGLSLSACAERGSDQGPITKVLTPDEARKVSGEVVVMLQDIERENPGYKIETLTVVYSPNNAAGFIMFALSNIANPQLPQKLLARLGVGEGFVQSSALTGPIESLLAPDKTGRVHFQLWPSQVKNDRPGADLWNANTIETGLRPLMDMVFDPAALPEKFRPPANQTPDQATAYSEWIIGLTLARDPELMAAMQAGMTLDHLTFLSISNPLMGAKAFKAWNVSSANRAVFSPLALGGVFRIAMLQTPTRPTSTPTPTTSLITPTRPGTISPATLIGTPVSRQPTPQSAPTPRLTDQTVTPGSTQPAVDNDPTQTATATATEAAHDFTFEQAKLDSNLASQYYADVKTSENPDQDFKGRVFNLNWTDKNGKSYTAQIVLGQKAYVELTNNGAVVPTNEQILAYITPDKIDAVKKDFELGRKAGFVIIYESGHGYMFGNFTYYAGNGPEPGVKILGADNPTNPYKLLKDLGVARFMWSDEAAAQSASGLAATDGSSIVGVQGSDGKYKQLKFPWSLSPALRKDQRLVETMWDDPSFTLEQKQAFLDKWLDRVIGKGFTANQITALKEQLHRLAALPSSVPLPATYTDGSGVAFKPYGYGGLVLGGTPQGNEIFSLLMRIKQIDNVPGLRNVDDQTGKSIVVGSTIDFSRKSIIVNSSYGFGGGSNSTMNMLMIILFESRNLHLFSLGSDQGGTMPIASKPLGVFTDRSNAGYLLAVIDAAVQQGLMARSEVSYSQFQTYFNQARANQPR